MHENDVWLYALEGEMHTRVGEEVVKATPASWVLKPRGSHPHVELGARARSASSSCTRQVGSCSFFEDFGERLRQGPIGLDELNRIGEPHGIRFFDDWISDLKAAYGLCLIGE